MKWNVKWQDKYLALAIGSGTWYLGELIDKGSIHWALGMWANIFFQLGSTMFAHRLMDSVDTWATPICYHCKCHLARTSTSFDNGHVLSIRKVFLGPDIHLSPNCGSTPELPDSNWSRSRMIHHEARGWCLDSKRDHHHNIYVPIDLLKGCHRLVRM